MWIKIDMIFRKKINESTILLLGLGGVEQIY